MRGEDLAPFLDHTVLRPDSRQHDIDQGCDAALLYKFRGIVVGSGAVTHAKRRLLNTGIKVIAAVGFPHGTQAPDIKSHEAMRASAMGADEIDYVISIGAALDGDWKFIQEEAIAIVRNTRGKILKAIIETGFLAPQQRVLAAQTLADAGIPYVKTCTGFGPGMATVEDVEMLVEAVQGRALIKASGKIQTRDQVIAMLQAGAAVVGTSRAPEICSDEE